MSAAEVVDGFWHAVLARAETPGLKVTDMPGTFRSRVEAALHTFYANNTAGVEDAPGVPGVNKPKAWQVGHEFGIVFSRQRAAAKTSDLGGVLAGRMTIAARAQKAVRLRMTDGVVSATERDG